MGVISEEKKEIIYGRKIPPPVVDSEKCVGCGECVRACPAQMFGLHDKKARVDTESTCIGCGHCWSVCPEEAVSQKEAVSLNGRKRGPDPMSGGCKGIATESKRLKMIFNKKVYDYSHLYEIIN